MYTIYYTTFHRQNDEDYYFKSRESAIDFLILKGFKPQGKQFIREYDGWLGKTTATIVKKEKWG